MEKFEYQANVGNSYFTHIEVTEVRGNKKICNAIMLHGTPGRSRWGKSYRNACWMKEHVEGIVLTEEDFTKGVKIVEKIEDYTN